MSLEQYSLALSIAVLLLAGLIVGVAIAAAISQRIRHKLRNIDYFVYIKSIALLALISTFGALIYQVMYRTPVCELCWWQRIFMFPIDIIALVAISYRVRVVHVMIGILATFGAAFAAYHYYYHFQIFVFGKTLSLPCSGYGLLPACTQSPILVFGFITIPLMALIVFIAIMALAWGAAKSERQ